MANQVPLLDDDVILNLIQTAQDPTGLADTVTAQWPARLAQRLNWLALWDTALAPLLLPVAGSAKPFALKPQRVNELLRAWYLGQPTHLGQAVPNSAALLLLAHQGSPGLASSIAAWGKASLSSTDAVQRRLRSAQAQAIKAWLQRWAHKEGELAMLLQIRALGGLTAQDQERLTKLEGKAFKTQLMQVAPQNPRIALHSYVDNRNMERYFRVDPQAAETLLALRAKTVSPASEQLHIGQWRAESFFNALRKAAARNTLLGANFNLDVWRVTFIKGDILDISDAYIFAHRSVELILLLTIAFDGEVAIFQLALIVPCVGLRVSDYCTKLLDISESGESALEKQARCEIVEKVLEEALMDLNVRSASLGTNSPVILAG